MVNKIVIFFSMIAFLGLSSSVNALSINDISNSQQSMIMLKAALEKAKLEKELSVMTDVKVSVAEVCANKGIGMLTLKAVYGINNKLIASFSYNSTTQIDAKPGDRLLCGELVKRVSLDKVEVEKDGNIYAVSGTVTAMSVNNSNIDRASATVAQ